MHLQKNIHKSFKSLCVLIMLIMRDFLLDILHQLLVQQGICKDAMAGNGGVPMSLLATLAGISRVVANKHTPVQVIAGAMLGFGVSYLVASRYIDPSIDRISFKHSKDIRQREAYSLSYAHSF